MTNKNVVSFSFQQWSQSVHDFLSVSSFEREIVYDYPGCMDTWISTISILKAYYMSTSMFQRDTKRGWKRNRMVVNVLSIHNWDIRRCGSFI